MKYARCVIKNIGLTIPEYWKNKPHSVAYPIEEVNILPNDCIRVKTNSGWCHECCTECEDDL